MKLFKSLFIALTCASLSFAGQMTINKAVSSYKINLSPVDSIVFKKDVQPNKSDSIYMQVKGTDIATEAVSNQLNTIRDLEFVPYQESDNESITIHVGSGTQKGDYKFLLKDIKSIDYPVTDDAVDTDEDGLTDVYELFYSGTHPQMKDTDGDGINDKDDPAPTNPSYPPVQNKVSGYILYDINGKKIGQTMELNGTMSVLVSHIPNTPIIVEISTTEPVKAFTATLNGEATEVTQISEKKFRVRSSVLKVTGIDAIKVEIIAENGRKSTQTLELTAPMSSFSSDVKLWLTEDIKAIDVAFAPNTNDDRIEYAILRATASKNANNTNLANLSLTTSNKPIEELLPAGVSVIKKIDNASLANYISPDNSDLVVYRDPVGANSSYYNYRVVAYVKDNIDGQNFYTYKISGINKRSTGKLRFYYKLIQVGPKYMHNVCTADMRLEADFYKSTQQKPAKPHYNYWYFDAGEKASDKNKIYWNDQPDNSKSDQNTAGIDQSVHSIDLYYNEDIKAILKNTADCGGFLGIGIDEKVELGATFKYEDLLNSATALDLAENEWTINNITYGKGGAKVTYDGDLNSSCSGCGDAPHAGWRFRFFVKWVESGD